MSLVFHGTVGAAITAVPREGLRFRRHEATVTDDLATAILIYGSCSGHPRAEHLCRSEDQGSVFLLPPGTFRPCLSPTSTIWLDPKLQAVLGGITKWIGGYMTLYRENCDPSCAEFRQLFREGKLHESIRWRTERSKLHTVPAVDIGLPITVDKDAIAWARGLDAEIRGVPPSVMQRPVPSSILLAFDNHKIKFNRQSFLTARCKRWIRRIAISILKYEGFLIYSTDTSTLREVPQSVLLTAEDARTRISKLEAFSRASATSEIGRAAELLDELWISLAQNRSETADILMDIDRISQPEIDFEGKADQQLSSS